MDFWKTALKETGKGMRKHATIGWQSIVTVIDDEWWLNCRVNGKGAFLYNLKKDPGMKKNVADANPDIVNRLFSQAVHDAGGRFPDYIMEQAEKAEDIPGCSAVAAKVSGL